MLVHDLMVAARTNMATAIGRGFCFNYWSDEGFDHSEMCSRALHQGHQGTHLEAAKVVVICSPKETPYSSKQWRKSENPPFRFLTSPSPIEVFSWGCLAYFCLPAW